MCGSRESHTVSNSEITEIIQKELWRMPYRPDALNYPVQGEGRMDEGGGGPMTVGEYF